jgi:hypothetical protein
MKRLSLLLGLVFCVSSCASTDSSQSRCSTVEDLIAAPVESEKPVEVCGLLKYEFEDRNLYGSKRAATEASREKCVSVGLADGFTGNLSAYNGRWVRVSGLVTADFCPDGTICTASCSATGIFVTRIDDLAR